MARCRGFRLSSNIVLTRHATGDGAASGRRHRPARGAEDRRPASREVFDVRKGSPDPEASALSGGNLQKFVVGREIDRKPTVLVVSQPTWGVDAGAATTIRQALVDLARSGSAILMISQDLDEILEISDRIAVISHGPSVGAADAREHHARGDRPDDDRHRHARAGGLHAH